MGWGFVASGAFGGFCLFVCFSESGRVLDGGDLAGLRSGGVYRGKFSSGVG